MNRSQDHTLSRRQFVQTAAAATAASTLGSVVKAAEPKKEKLRAAIIGCRNRGWQLANNFNASGRFDVVTMCDCDDAMYDQGLHALHRRNIEISPKFVKDFRQVLDDTSIHAVAIAAPDQWHALMTIMALEAGKHVYVEKPASYDVRDGRAMVKAQEKHPDLTVQVGTQQRSGQHWEDCRQFIAEGGIGKVGFARAYAAFTRHFLKESPVTDPPKTLDYDLWTGPAPMRPYARYRVHYNWHFIEGYGTGDVTNWGVHWMDSTRHLLDLGYPRKVSAQGFKLVEDAKEWPDTFSVLYEYPELSVIWEMRSWTTHRINGRGLGIEIGGDKGTVVIDRGGWEFDPREGETVKHKGSNQDVAHAQNFADCITGDAKPNSPIEEGHISTAMCNLANVANAVGHTIEWDAETETVTNDKKANEYLGREYREPWTMPA